MAIQLSTGEYCTCGARESHNCPDHGGALLTLHRNISAARSPVAVNTISLDLFTGKRADSAPEERPAVASSQLSEIEIAICAKMHCSHADYLVAKARNRAGKHPLSDDILGGNGGKRSAGPVAATGGFKAR
jgi:hypothetical protein